MMKKLRLSVVMVARVEKVATAVPNVMQVANNLQVKNHKASSSQ